MSKVGHPFSKAILEAKRQGVLPLVADIKPISPRDGNLIGPRSPGNLARELVAAGACALSVVTESTNFGGSLDLLCQICAAAPAPVLRKDFFSSPAQIEESQAAGASAVLVILATTPDDLAFDLCRTATSLGMEAVVEVHTKEELARALRLNPTIIGINNRNILQLEKDEGDVQVTEELVPAIPEGIVTLSASSLLTEDSIRRAIRAGADAVLVGTAVLRAADPAGFVRAIVKEG